MALLFHHRTALLQVGNKHKSDEMHSGRGNLALTLEFEVLYVKEHCVQYSRFSIVFKKLFLLSQVKSHLYRRLNFD